MTQLAALGLASWMVLAPAIERPSPSDVLAMMAEVDASGIYARVGHAREIADAIAEKAEALDGLSLRESEALMVVFAAKESANQLCPVGDGGKSLGTFQLQGVTADVACHPTLAIPVWIAEPRLRSPCARATLPTNASPRWLPADATVDEKWSLHACA